MSNMARIAEARRLFYTLGDISDLTGLSTPSTWKFLNRKVKRGEILRVRRDLYVLPDRFVEAKREELFRIANVVQTPSYISYMTALAYYELTTQIPLSVIESVNSVRSRTYEVRGFSFRYYFCRPPFYFGYRREKGFFIGEPEKALLDSLYLISLGRYALDHSALNLRNVRWKKLESWLKKYPTRFKNFFKSWRGQYEGA